MHELSIAQNLIDLVTEALQKECVRSVVRIHLQIGTFSSVLPEALAFGYELATRGTLLEGSSLAIQIIPLMFHCPRCDRAVEPAALHDWHCPQCSAALSQIVQGRELELIAIEVEDRLSSQDATPRPDQQDSDSTSLYGNSLA
jgi:hydrogenase nickel incorporation protein HypA/HybF